MKETKYSRRRFLSNAAMLLGTAEIAMLGLMNTSFNDSNAYEKIHFLIFPNYSM
jgi:hypothetical protein